MGYVPSEPGRQGQLMWRTKDGREWPCPHTTSSGACDGRSNSSDFFQPWRRGREQGVDCRRRASIEGLKRGAMPTWTKRVTRTRISWDFRQHALERRPIPSPNAGHFLPLEPIAMSGRGRAALCASRNRFCSEDAPPRWRPPPRRDLCIRRHSRPIVDLGVPPTQEYTDIIQRANVTTGYAGVLRSGATRTSSPSDWRRYYE